MTTARGLYLEEFTSGQLFEHFPGRTVTDADNTLFCALTGNPAAIHLDAVYAQSTAIGERLVNGMFVLSWVIAASVSDTTQGTTVAQLAMTDIEHRHPVFLGDTLRSVTRVLEVRASKSRPDTGVVIFEHTGLNQHGKEVVKCKRTALMLRQPQGGK